MPLRVAGCTLHNLGVQIGLEFERHSSSGENPRSSNKFFAMRMILFPYSRLVLFLLLCQPSLQIAQPFASDLDVAFGGLVGLLGEAIEHIDHTAQLGVKQPIPSIFVLIAQRKHTRQSGAIEPESRGRSPFCNRRRSPPRFSWTSLGKLLITLRELPSKTTSGGRVRPR